MCKTPVILKLIVLALLVWLLEAGPTPALAQKPDRTGSDKFKAGEVLVKFKPQVGQQTGKDRLQREGAKIVKVLPRSGLLRIKVTPGSEQQAVAQLMARSDVEFAALNHLVTAFETPNDPSFGSQWGMTKIEGPAAWDISHGAASVIIAVVDTGVDLDHPDLANKLWVNSDEIPGNGFDDDHNGYIDDVNGYDFYNFDAFPDDDHSHGSHVAGIAAASTNNGTGVAGVSWGARIMPLKVLSAGGSGTTADVAEAIYYAVDNGAKVINLSLGAAGTSWPCYWPDVENAFQYADSHGVLLVVASGNDGKYGVSCPAAYDQAMAVGSTTSSDTLSYFSNYGPRLEVVAPGSGIYSTWSNGSYGTKSGTSMATPHVAGLSALVWGMDPGMTANQVRELIKSSADDLGSAGVDDYFGYGRINAYRAMQNFVAINLTGVDGSQLNQPLTFLVDDQAVPVPAGYTLEITTSLTSEITWTATISPTANWLNLSSQSGTVSAASATQFNISATRPTTYGLYSTAVVVTGTTTSGLTIGPTVETIQINYLSELYRYRFPLIFKN